MKSLLLLFVGMLTAATSWANPNCDFAFSTHTKNPRAKLVCEVFAANRWIDKDRSNIMVVRNYCDRANCDKNLVIFSLLTLQQSGMKLNPNSLKPANVNQLVSELYQSGESAFLVFRDIAQFSISGN